MGNYTYPQFFEQKEQIYFQGSFFWSEPFVPYEQVCAQVILLFRVQKITPLIYSSHLNESHLQQELWDLLSENESIVPKGTSHTKA